ncbi:leucine-rich repeat and calponin homology domain-containing protein 4-like isoform X2 [Actinia tenebrosa]|uniref:Leucine-rich repeat and calponin homology domain-containing protein 4-like isoform X2 n=1 Tax=Actinia tenebrosa TaxID=6105 RepID=A0A6P8INS8_ACTTE|nr:leucine-rich repeat and calponin homology domain-containing protein 4-like isoform X2 [Actinia tenebrosa]
MTGNKSIEKCFEEAEETGLLNLGNKGLRDFPDVAGDCELIDVIEADLSKNRFAEFPIEICDFIMLERLDLYHNAIRSVPELDGLKWLTKLNLRRNQVCSLPLSLGLLPLRVLNLSNNRLTSLPVEIGYLTLLQDLDLSCNELTRLPSSMGEMISLKDLNVRRNELQALPDELSKLKLVKLDFSCNRVSVIPPAYRLMTTLSCLEISHNPLTSPPAHVCIKGRQHIFKYLSVVAQQQEKKRTLDRDIRKPYSMGKKSSTASLKEEYLMGDSDHIITERVRRTHSLDMSGAGYIHQDDKESYRPSSLRERDRQRKPLSNVFENEERRKKVQKEIEQAKRLLSETMQADDRESGSIPDGELNEGEQLKNEFLSIEIEERQRREEEERQIEERRRTARKLQKEQQEIIQQQKAADSRIRRTEKSNGTMERRRSNAMSRIDKPDLPPRPSTLERSRIIDSSRKPRASSLGAGVAGEGETYRSRQEQDMKARMQQSRREAQLSRQRLEEERQKSMKKDSPLSRDSLSSKDKDSSQALRSPEIDVWEESIFHNIHKRSTNLGHVRSLPAALKQHEDSKFTMKRMFDSAREEFEKLEILREALESRLKVTLPDDLPTSLADGVVLCHLINSVCKGTIPSIHIPSAGVPKLTMTKCMKNVDSFLEACKKLGVRKDALCSPADILEEKSPMRVCNTVQALLEVTNS